MLTIQGKSIEPVGIIEDNEDARRGYAWTLEDAQLRPLPAQGPLGELDSFASTVPESFDALLCDHHLRPSNYASFDGVELVDRLYGKVPAVLCTNWQQAELDVIRDYRARVPVLLTPDQLDPDSFVAGIDLALREFAGEFTDERRPWRSQVHVVDIDRDSDLYVFVRLPGWVSDDVIRLRKAGLPVPMREAAQVDTRWHALVNVGAESADDLYFIEWELP